MRKAFPTSDKEQLGSIDIYQSVGWRQTSKIIAHIYRELIMARHCPICPHILCSEKAMAPRSNTLAWKIHFHALEKEMAPHSSTLAWKIPWMEELCRLQSMGLQRVKQNWATSPPFFLAFPILKLPGHLPSFSALISWQKKKKKRGDICYQV